MTAEHTPKLPLELERAIFENAAHDNNNVARKLVLIAHRVHIWIEPFLHRICYLDLNGLSEDLIQHRILPKPLRIHQHLRHLAISVVNPPYAEISQLLERCVNVVDFALWTNGRSPDLLDALRPLTQLQRLSVELFRLLGGNRENPKTTLTLPIPSPERLVPLRTITHLDVYGDKPAAVIPFLSTLPALTHLALSLGSSDEFPRDLSPELTRTCLETLPALRVLVVLTTDLDATEREEIENIVNDARFCVLLDDDFLLDWKTGARGGPCFWDRAELRIAEKAAKTKEDRS
ncbi:hypothetical protein MKEN_01156200 [Mycena kentingensis (nom. inval.)]|nr:hypothetical protein MKEN_01156200 [Mycena kentingensis (nom. inval.)]